MYEFFETHSQFDREENKTIFYQMLVYTTNMEKTPNRVLMSPYQEFYLYFIDRNTPNNKISHTHKTIQPLKSKIEWCVRDKFILLYHILVFFTKEKRELLMRAFYQTQKYYMTLLRFVQLCKLKKMRQYDIQHDMYYVNFVDISPKFLITIPHTDCKYTFNIKNLVKIILSGLGKSFHLFPSPKTPKNPYTNIEFTRANLYNIYFKCRELHISRLPPLFEEYFACNFDITVFTKKNRELLNVSCVENYLITNEPTEEHVAYIHDMLTWFYKKSGFSIRIFNGFPKKTLWTVMSPYLKLYLLGVVVNRHANHYAEVLKSYLIHFYKYNPHFGNKIEKPNIFSVWTDEPVLRPNTTDIFRPVVAAAANYNTTHIPFHYIEPKFHRTLDDVRIRPRDESEEESSSSSSSEDSDDNNEEDETDSD